MNNKRTLTICLLFFTLALLSSCIQKEALGSEAAIDKCEGEYILLCSYEPDNFKIHLYVSRAADICQLEIKFTVAPGATILPTTLQDSDTGLTPSQNEDNVFTGYFNFAAGSGNTYHRQFTVTSENKIFTATYDIDIRQTDMPKIFHFENLTSSDPYHIFYEQEGDSLYIEWASGNEGYKLTSMASTATDYPTTQVSGGYSGKCVKLETCDAGNFGAMVDMPIASGNLFIGSFDLSNALADANGATHFGYPFTEVPVRIEGWYKYTAGDKFIFEGAEVTGRKDHCDIYAMLYETDDEVQYLDGRNSFTSDHLVLLARLPEGTYWDETNTWTPFSLDFEPKNGRKIDYTKLANGVYKLGIVFSSSIEGNIFNGAIGSTLYIDEVTITTTSDEQ